MYLIRRKSDNLVQYAFHERPRIGRFLKYPIMALDVSLSTHEIIKGDIPEGFVPGAYSFDKRWSVINQKVVDAAQLRVEPPRKTAEQELLRLKREQEGKALTMAYLDKRLTEIERILGV